MGDADPERMNRHLSRTRYRDGLLSGGFEGHLRLGGCYFDNLVRLYRRVTSAATHLGEP
jgi:hypothetical protein